MVTVGKGSTAFRFLDKARGVEVDMVGGTDMVAAGGSVMDAAGGGEIVVMGAAEIADMSASKCLSLHGVLVLVSETRESDSLGDSSLENLWSGC